MGLVSDGRLSGIPRSGEGAACPLRLAAGERAELRNGDRMRRIGIDELLSK